MDPPAEPPLNDRYRGAEFYFDNGTLYLYSSASRSPRLLVYATAELDKPAQNELESLGKATSSLPDNSSNESSVDAETTKDKVRKKPNQVVPEELGSLDEILEGVELQTVYETTFDESIRMIHEDKLMEDQKIVRQPPEDVDWVLEGAAEVFVKEGRLHIENDSHHSVLLNTRKFPESFVADWDFRHHAPQGTAIIFFAAQANDGGSIFTPGLPKRGGRFGNYTRGEINCYHTSYTATDEEGVPRGATHLKKDGKDVDKGKLANGLAPIDGKTGKPFRIRLAKLRNRIILEIDGKISFDVIDTGEEKSSSYTSGQIGFRQMRHTLRASYGGLKVQSVEFPSE
jgi:hypothetical protein